MSQFYVEHQGWVRWPRTLIMCKKTGYGIERKRYVPEGGTRDEWYSRMREAVRKYKEASDQLNAKMLEESEVPNLKAEIDGLKLAIEERDNLIRDMFAEMIDYNVIARYVDKAIELGIEVDDTEHDEP